MRPVSKLKADSSADLTIGGATLAATAITAGLVDECVLFVRPATVGGGKAALPANVKLTLLDEQRFANGVVLLRYRPSA